MNKLNCPKHQMSKPFQKYLGSHNLLMRTIMLICSLICFTYFYLLRFIYLNSAIWKQSRIDLYFPASPLAIQTSHAFLFSLTFWLSSRRSYESVFLRLCQLNMDGRVSVWYLVLYMAQHVLHFFYISALIVWHGCVLPTEPQLLLGDRKKTNSQGCHFYKCFHL